MLQTQQAMEMGIETSKMARIANIETAEATEYMTSAVRGFNLEINEMSAQRINDVYSELAAISATNTEGIGVAMSKTASIAHSANMELETTAAFLAQIIETTQESSETAGTSLKTVISRFSEVKSLREKGETTGEDDEGETVDVNKIQTALRSVGISMEDYFSGAEGLDSILLKLAEKWDTLDFEMQRYIATQAAGSRQQSRFLALMSDYDRTMELVDAAYNSTGASQEQFEKTQDSLQTKLSNLKTAWQEFTMGLANNEAIKVMVDLLTTLLNTINKVIDALSGGNGLVKSLLSIGTSILAFKGSKKLLGKTEILSLIGINKKDATSAGEDIKNNFIGGFNKKNKTGASNIFQNLFQRNGKSVDFSSEQLNQFFGLDQLDFSDVNTTGLNKLKSNIAFQLNGFPEEVSKKVDWSALAGASNMNEVKQALGDASDQIQFIGQDAQEANVHLKSLTPTFNGIATGAGLAGGAMMILASSLEKSGKSEKTVGIIRSIGTALMTLPAIFQVVTIAAKKMGMDITATIASIPIVGWIAIVTSALIAFGGILASAIDTPEEKLKKAEKSLETANQAAQEASESYNNLKESLKEIQEFDNVFDGLVYGTEAWRDAIIENNEKVLELLSNYKELAPYVENQNGRLIFNEKKEVNGKTVEDVQNDYADRALEQQRNANYASVVVEQQKYDNEKVKKINEITAGSTYEYEYDYDSIRMQKIASDAGYTTNGFIDDEFYNSKEFDDYTDKIEKGNILAQTSLMEEQDGIIWLSQQGKDIVEQLALEGINNTDEEEVIRYLKYNASELGIKDFSEDEYSAFADYLSSLGNDFQELSTALQTSVASLNAQNDAMASSVIEDFISKQGINTTTEEGVLQASIYRDYATGEKYAELTEANKEKIGNKPGKNNQDYKDYIYEKYGEENIEKINKDGSVKLASGGTISADTMKATYASHLADSAIIEGAQGYEDIVNSISEKDSQIGKIFSGQQGTQLTQLDLEKILGQSIEEAIDDTTGKIEADENSNFYKTITEAYDSAREEAEERGTVEEFEELYGTREDFVASSYEKLNNGAELSLANAKHQAELIQKTAQISDVTTDLTASANESIYGVYDKVSAQAGAEGVAKVSEKFEDFIGNVEERDRSKVADIFGSIDWTQADAIEDFKQALEDAGLEAYAESDSFNELTQELKETTMAADAFDLSNIKDQVKEKFDLIDEIKDNKTGTFDEETMKALVEAGANKEDFVWNGQEFIYIGGTMEELSGKLESNTNQLLANTAALTENKIKSGEEFSGLGDFLKGSDLYKDKAERIMSGDLSGIGEYGKSYILKAMAGDSGYITDSQNGQQIDVSSLDAIKDADLINRLLVEGIENYNNLTENKQKAKDTDAVIMTVGKTSEEIYSNGGTEEQQVAASLNEAIKQGIDVDSTKEYAQELINITKESKNVEELSKAMATEIAKDNQIMNEGIKNLSENWDTWGSALKSSQKESSEYTEAISGVRKALKQIMGTTEDVSDAFFDNTKNLALMEKAADGDAKAIKALRKEVAKDLIIQMGLDDDSTQQVTNTISNILDSQAYEDLEIGVSLQDTAFYDALQGLLDSGTVTVEQMNGILDGINFAPEVGTEEVVVQSYDSTNQTAQVMGVDGQIKTVKLNSQVDSGATITIPTIGNSKFKGAPSKTINPSNKKKGGGGGGSKKTEKQTWENPYDELYNTMEKINELERQRNKLEDDYDRLLEKRSSTLNQLLSNQQKTLKNLQEEKKLQLQVQKAELAQVKNAKNYEYLGTKTNKSGDEEKFWTTFQAEATRLGLGNLDNYAKYDASTGTMSIDWNRIEKIEDNTKTGELQGALIEAYIAYLEENSEAYEEATDLLAEIEDEVNEINQRGIEEFLATQTQIYDALVSQREQEIDSIENVFDGIDESNSKILDGLQEQIDLQRQTRDNTKKEEDIADMEARLAYLRRDTSGANALEIKQLEEQLGDAREEYSDTLVDQYLQKLQDNEKKASEQRQNQIEIARAQLDYDEKTGAFWDKVYDLWKDAFKKDGSVDENSELFNLLKDAENFAGMSKEQQTDFIEKLVSQLLEAGQGDANLEKKEKDAELEKKKTNDKVKDVLDSKGNKIGTLTKTSDGKWETSKGNTYDNIEWDTEKKAYVATGYTKKVEDPTPKTGNNDDEDKYPYGKASETKGVVKKGSKGDYVKAIQFALNKLGYGNDGTSKVDGSFGSNTKKAVVAFQKAMGLKKDGKVGDNTRAKFKAKGYKTGGLADYTGPAWLDGTPTKPELVLNSKDTQNFIQLKDILSNVFANLSGKASGASGGDNYFDINIVVDEISNDYDVDRLAEKIKQQIYDDSTYRNVNAISWIR